MKIGIIGAGNMGTGLGKYWARNKHELMLSYSRDENKLRAAAASVGKGVRTGSAAEAAGFGDVVLLATPYAGTPDAIRAAGSLDGKIVFGCVNPFQPDFSGMIVGTTTSGAEEMAKLARGAKYVAALPSSDKSQRSSASLCFGGTCEYLLLRSVFCGADDSGISKQRELKPPTLAALVDGNDFRSTPRELLDR